MIGRFRQTEFLGIRFDCCSVEHARIWAEEAAGGAAFRYIVTPNVDHLVTFHEDGAEGWRTAYRVAVTESDLCVNDSRVLALLARGSDIALPVVPGSDLTHALVSAIHGKGGAVALVGGNESERQWLRTALPNSSIQHFAPPMGVRENEQAQDAIATFVEESRADYVFLAFGSPQSEIVANAIARRGKARGVALCIGASIEFLSGKQRRAPAAMRAVGLEWLFRLVTDPRRLWRRYLVKGPRIFAIWWKARDRGRDDATLPR